jgi:hypothetical protein
LRTAVLVAGLLALVGVVAVAAAGRGPAAGESRPSADAPTLFLDYVSTLALLLIPLGAILIVVSAFVRRAYAVKTETASHSNRTLIVGILLGLLVIPILGSRLGWTGWRESEGTGAKTTTPATTTKDSKGKARPAVSRYQPQFRWLPILLLGSVFVAFIGAAGVLVYRRRYASPPPPVAEVLSEVLGETLDDLRNEPDPRKAVIRAYARMERTLAARGLPREPFEAPLEYLARILGAVQASAHSVRRLTGLFERARFSPHEIDARMKNEAIDALSGLRAELAVPR